MAHTFNKHTMLWTITETAALSADLANAAVAVVKKVIYIPSAATDDVVLQDGTASEDAIVLKAGASDASPVHVDFSPEGRTVTNLTCSTIDGGTLYVYLM